MRRIRLKDYKGMLIYKYIGECHKHVICYTAYDENAELLPFNAYTLGELKNRIDLYLNEKGGDINET